MVIMTTPASASEPRTTRANNSREQILDAYEHLLVQAGERAATLDAVAAPKRKFLRAVCSIISARKRRSSKRF